ncbi:MAG: hypothetical protein GY950_11240, partial [bacterium]|nr:hypothetical protein [bacterium]
MTKQLNSENTARLLALTPLQEGMLFHYLKSPQSDLYFEQLTLELQGPLNREHFNRAWNFVVEANEMLRTLFRWEKVKNPVQVVLKQYHLEPVYYDLSAQRERLETIKKEDRSRSFDLHHVPFRVTLCRLAEETHVMIISCHHILYDGWSNGIILEEFFNAYSGDSLPVKEKGSFAEFVRWVQKQDREKQKLYWRDYLAGFDSKPELPFTGSKETEDFSGDHIEILPLRFSPSWKREIDGFVTAHKITLAALFYSAWGLLLREYGGSDDVVFGTTVAGRGAGIKGIENTVGLFINTLPLRVRAAEKDTAGDILRRAHRDLRQREQYESSALVDIRDCSELPKGQPLFDSIMVIENYPLDRRLTDGASGLTDLTVRSFSVFEMTHYDLTVS